jgi:alginate O-acetyltransferase complex protein AlgJ
MLWDDYETRARRRRVVLTSILFCVGLWAPLVAKILGVDPFSEGLEEKRLLRSPPPTPRDMGALRTFPRDFDVYYAEHFGLRPALVRLDARVTRDAFGESSNPAVVVGREGWLFLASEGSIGLYRRLVPLTSSQLRHYRRALEERTQWLARRGIPYVLAVAPEKATVYPEHMPTRYTRLSGQTRLDQLAAALADSNVDFLDLRPALLRAKERDLVYDPTDSHWNQLGAYVAYRALLTKAAHDLPRLTPHEATPTEWSLQPGGDLARLLGLSSSYKIRSPQVDLVVPSPSPVDWSEEGYAMPSGGPHRLGRLVVPAESRGRRALVFHDSFTQLLYEFVAPHFEQVSFYWSRAEFWADTIEKASPAIVMHVVAERGLVLHPLMNPVVVRRTPGPEDIQRRRQASHPGLRGATVPRAGIRLLAGRFVFHEDDAELITMWESLEDQILTAGLHVTLADADGTPLHAQFSRLDDRRSTVARGRVWEDHQVFPLESLRAAASVVLSVYGADNTPLSIQRPGEGVLSPNLLVRPADLR